MDKEKKKRRIIIGIVFLSVGLSALGIGLHSMFLKLSEMGRIVFTITFNPTSEDERRFRRLTDDDLTIMNTSFVNSRQGKLLLFSLQPRILH